MPQAAGREAPGQGLLTLFGPRLPESVLPWLVPIHAARRIAL